MRAIYGWLVVGLLLTPAAVRPDPDHIAVTHAIAVAHPHSPKPAAPSKRDPRAVRLQRFLNRLHSPAASLADVFVREADENHLDWRLLPGISVVESGAGKSCRNNNIFGWNNGNEPFPSVEAGIHEVAHNLGRSRLYRNRGVVGKLRLYNSEDEEYVDKVLAVMNQLGGVPVRPIFTQAAN